MNKFYSTVIFIIFSFINCLGQVIFQNSYGDSSGFGHLEKAGQTLDGGYFLAGGTDISLSDSGEFFFTKTDSIGNVQWSKTFGGQFWDYCQYAEQTSDSGYILAGRTQETGVTNIKVWLIKIDKNGNHLWNKAYDWNGVSSTRCVHQTTDGGFVILSTSIIISKIDFTVVKTDSVGNVMWANSYGNSAISEFPHFIQQTSDSGYILVGGIESSKVYLIKIDNSGSLQWWKSIGGPWFNGGAFVQETFDGGYIVAGHTSGFGNQSSEEQGYLIKTTSTGIPVWSKTLRYIGEDIGFTSVKQTRDSGYIVSGNSQNYIHLIRFNPMGDSIWTKNYFILQAELWESEPTIDGGYLISAQLYNQLYDNAYLIKTDSLGNSNCFEENVIFTYSSQNSLLYSYLTPVTNLTVLVTSPPLNIDTGEMSAKACFSTNTSELVSKNNLFITPNPAKDIVDISADIAVKSIQVVNILGIIQTNLIIDFNPKAIRLDVSKLALGIYIIKVKSETGISSVRFVKD